MFQKRTKQKIKIPPFLIRLSIVIYYGELSLNYSKYTKYFLIDDYVHPPLLPNGKFKNAKLICFIRIFF